MKIVTLVTFVLLSSSYGWCQQEDTNSSQTGQQRIIRYPIDPKATLYKHQSDYFIALFQLALQKSHSSLEVNYFFIPNVPQGRSATLIEDGVYDIHWLVTNNQRESKLAPIRIPLYKGLIGLRLAFVDKDKANLLAKSKTIAQLRKLIVGQGIDWPDTQILQNSKFNVFTTTKAESLFEMLSVGRIDYFPRSIVEIWAEQELMQNSDVVIDQHIAIFYPEAVYFFVRKNDAHLHQVIEQGLKAALDDGSFDRLFYQHFGDIINRANLDKRLIFELENPFLPLETPLSDTRMWINLKESLQ